MDIFFCGDPHGKFEKIIEASVKHKPKAIFLLGDMGLEVPLEVKMAPVLDAGVEVYWIHGNHDCDEEIYYDNLFNSELKDNNVHGRVVDVNGVKVAGLGGVFRGKIWFPKDNKEAKFADKESYLKTFGKHQKWRGVLPLKQQATIFPDDLAKMENLQADILITHEAPGCHKFGFSVLDDLAAKLKAKTIFHGHHHRDYIDTTGDIKVVGVGLGGVCDSYGKTISPEIR